MPYLEQTENLTISNIPDYAKYLEREAFIASRSVARQHELPAGFADEAVSPSVWTLDNLDIGKVTLT
jgi:hypothetical protein